MVFLGRDLGEQRNYSEDIASEIDQEVHHLVETAFLRAKEVLRRRENVLRVLATRLTEVETMEGAEMKRHHRRDRGPAGDAGAGAGDGRRRCVAGCAGTRDRPDALILADGLSSGRSGRPFSPGSLRTRPAIRPESGLRPSRDRTVRRHRAPGGTLRWMPDVTCSSCWLWQPLGRSTRCRACGAPLITAGGMRVDQGLAPPVAYAPPPGYPGGPPPSGFPGGPPPPGFPVPAYPDWAPAGYPGIVAEASRGTDWVLWVRIAIGVPGPPGRGAADGRRADVPSPHAAGQPRHRAPDLGSRPGRRDPGRHPARGHGTLRLAGQVRRDAGHPAGPGGHQRRLGSQPASAPRSPPTASPTWSTWAGTSAMPRSCSSP